ncbi:uncharacterized protein LOC134253888 [Saccostrea cucullata]|uniref:uncharacterized protein LOC134253888 n=1 Tax=Saccostrea cuccullata TaxID=36930 RepID=UPI002ED20693
MEKRYFGFLIALMLIACKLLYCHAFLESPVKKKNVAYIGLKEEILKLAKDSVTEGILKVRRELAKSLEDLRLDMMRRDVELFEEIYNMKENLTGNDTAREKQTTSLDDRERKVSIKKFEYLEAGMKKAAQESKNNADTLQENVERLDRENRRILSRMDTMEITLMKVASQSSVNLNDTEGLIFKTYLQKLQHVDDRLNDINDTMQDVCYSTTEMQKAIGTFQSEVMELKSYVNALSDHVNSTLDHNTIAIQNLEDLSKNIQLNMSQVINDNEQHFSNELLLLMRNISEVSNLSISNLNYFQDLLSHEKHLEVQVNHSKQDLKNEMTALKNQINNTVTNWEDLKDKQLEISDDLMKSNLKISSLSDAWNVTNEELGSLNNSLSEKLTDFKTQVQLVFKENLNQNEQLTNITGTVDYLRRKVDTLKIGLYAPKKLFHFLKHAKKDSCGVSPLKEGGLLKSEPVVEADILNRQFQSVFSPKYPSSLSRLCNMKVSKRHISTPHQAESTSFTDQPSPARRHMPEIKVTKEGIEKVLKNLKTHKTAGTNFFHTFTKRPAPRGKPYTPDPLSALL